jgi:hypothetical protein
MAILKILVDDSILSRARIRAQAERTSVEAVLVKSLESSAGSSPQEQTAAIAGLLELARQSKSRSGGKRWSRDELHERK